MRRLAVMSVCADRVRAKMLISAVAEWVIAWSMLLLFITGVLGRSLFLPNTYPGIPGDTGLYQWYIGWLWYAIVHHQPIFVTSAFGYPGTTNLMSQTTVPALGLLFGWLYSFIGLAATNNLIFAVNYAMIMVFGKLTLKQLGANRAFSWIGAGLFVVMPYLSAQEYGHTFLYFVGFGFALGYLVTRLFVVEKSTSFLDGFLIGACTTLIFYISLEIALSTLLFGAMLFLCACVVAPRPLWAKVKMIMTPGFVTGVLVPTLLVIPGILNFEQSVGRRALVALVYQQVYVNDLLNFIVPTPVNLLHNSASNIVASHYTGNFSENDGYMSIPAIVLLIFAAARTWTSKVTRILVPTVVIMIVLSLGESLHIAGVVSKWTLPWKMFANLPLFNSMLPSRFGLYFQYASVIVITLAANTYFEQQSLPQINIARVVDVASVLLVAILWLPAPLPSSRIPESAQILSSHAVSSAFLDDKTVLFLAQESQVPVLMGVLAASGNYSFRTPSNYGTSAANLSTPSMLQTLAVADTTPGIFASDLEAYLLTRHLNEVAFVSPNDQPIILPLRQEMDSVLGSPVYDNQGLVVVWTVPAVVKTDKLTYTADLLYRALAMYLNERPANTSTSPITVQKLVNAGIFPLSFLNSPVSTDPNWTSFSSWIGTWSGNEVAFSVYAMPVQAQAIATKYSRSTVEIQYPWGTRVQTDAQGNPIIRAAPNEPPESIFVLFNSSALVRAYITK